MVRTMRKNEGEEPEGELMKKKEKGLKCYLRLSQRYIVASHPLPLVFVHTYICCYLFVYWIYLKNSHSSQHCKEYSEIWNTVYRNTVYSVLLTSAVRCRFSFSTNLWWNSRQARNRAVTDNDSYLEGNSYRRWRSVVGIATRLQTGRSRVRILAGSLYFMFPDTGSRGSTHPLSEWLPRLRVELNFYSHTAPSWHTVDGFTFRCGRQLYRIEALCPIYVPPRLTLRHLTFCPHSVFMCFACISE
jgi:hypothetical protein